MKPKKDEEMDNVDKLIYGIVIFYFSLVLFTIIHKVWLGC